MTILKAENISKQYRLGNVGTGTLSHDLNRIWNRVRGKEDPYLKVGAVNDRSSKTKVEYVWALRDINFEVEQGEVLGIIGKNGAGKSTLLKILSRVTSPTTGVIKTKGRIASLLEVGTGFHPELTGRENVYLNGAILGMTRAEISAKMDEIIEFSGCELYIDTPVKRYSSGMTVRLAFAVAAHLEPDILVIDEVLAVGDAEFQKKAIGKMQDISTEQGRTVLFVSHNMAAVQSLCSRAMVLDNGTIVFKGETKKGIDYYLNSKTEKALNFIAPAKDLGITKIEFLDSNKNPISTILIGQEIHIQISFNNPGDRQISLSLEFFDNYERFMFACRSDVVNKLFRGETGVATLIINKWPASEGIYSYNTLMYFRNKGIEVLYDVGNIHVEVGDFYGFGKLPAPSRKGFYADYSWD